ncbi:TPA_asm: hypothetical protein [Powellomyces chytrid fungus MELD virus 3]|nr:TPA_asm: hypothetical protein [Powellomyces chytrid fungus MELD virus 3]
MSIEPLHINMNSSPKINLPAIFKLLAPHKPHVYKYDPVKKTYPINSRATKLLHWSEAQLLGNVEDFQGTVTKIRANCAASKATVCVQYMGHIHAHWKELIELKELEILQLYGFPDDEVAKITAAKLNRTIMNAVPQEATVHRAKRTFSAKDKAAIGDMELDEYCDGIKAKVLEATTRLVGSANTTWFEYGRHIGLLDRLCGQDRRSIDHALQYCGSTSNALILFDEFANKGKGGVDQYFPCMKRLPDVHIRDKDENVIQFKIDYKKRFNSSPLNETGQDSGFFYVDSTGKPLTRDNWAKTHRRLLKRICEPDAPRPSLLRRLQITLEEPHNMSVIEITESSRAHGHSAVVNLTYDRRRDPANNLHKDDGSVSSSGLSSKRAKTGIAHSASRSDIASVDSSSEASFAGSPPRDLEQLVHQTVHKQFGQFQQQLQQQVQLQLEQQFQQFQQLLQSAGMPTKLPSDIEAPKDYKHSWQDEEASLISDDTEVDVESRMRMNDNSDDESLMATQEVDGNLPMASQETDPCC